MKTTTALILAAGANTRFFPFNSGHHKGLVSLMGRPLLLQTLESMREVGIEHVVLILSPLDVSRQNWQEMIAGFGIDLEVQVVVQTEPKGAGNAVLLAAEHLTDSFIVTHPYYFEVGKVLTKLDQLDTPNVVCAKKVEDPWNFGVLTVEGNLAKGIVEKPEKGSEPSNLKSVVIHRLDQAYLEILRNIPEEEYSYEKALDLLMKNQTVEFLELEETLPSLKYAWDLFEVQSKLFANLQAFQSDSAMVASTAIIDQSSGPVVIEQGAKVGDFAKIIGPAYIGQNAMVGDYSFVRQSSLEQGANVGAKTEIVRSILLEGCDVHFGYVADSILGRNVKIGAGLIAANKRHDRKNIVMHVKNKKTETNRNNYGVMIGDNSKLGVRVTTMPGVMIGADCTIMPSVTVTKNVEHRQVVVSS